jgi:hypothetical protein
MKMQSEVNQRIKTLSGGLFKKCFSPPFKPPEYVSFCTILLWVQKKKALKMCYFQGFYNFCFLLKRSGRDCIYGLSILTDIY